MMYRTYRTTMGRKYRMRVAEDERRERILFRAVITMLPLVTVVGMFVMWIKEI